jgi:hypothetical protein
MQIDNQNRPGFVDTDGTMHIRVSPKSAGGYSYSISSNVAALNGKSGAFSAYRPPEALGQQPSPNLANWYTDDPSSAVAEGEHIGAKTVNKWRTEFLDDFAARMDRCKAPASN